MLIYLDANIVQYCADEWKFIFGEIDRSSTTDPKLQKELVALRRLVELEQLGDWEFAAPRHLLYELNAGTPTDSQRETYQVLHEAWHDSVWVRDDSPAEEKVQEIEASLSPVGLKHAGDRRHLAEALALAASWFLTNDREVLRKTKGLLRGMRVCLPSKSIEEVSIGLFLNDQLSIKGGPTTKCRRFLTRRRVRNA